MKVFYVVGKVLSGTLSCTQIGLVWVNKVLYFKVRPVYNVGQGLLWICSLEVMSLNLAVVVSSLKLLIDG